MNQQLTELKDNNENNTLQLEILKSKIFGGNDNDNSQTRILIQIMREVGGYDNLMNMPITAVKEVHDFLKWESDQYNKKIHKK